ncbi:MAG: 2-dehydropantoate 2-reductase [Rhodospirillales bacterium]|nr:2-dehydropantoate 2-reductase [Rhodospirillales bacterium]
MKIAIMGSGGIGGYFGGRLAAAGQDVTFIARGDHLKAMQADGLKIESEHHGDAVVKPVQATDDPSSVGPVDYIIFGVKLWATADAAEDMKPMIGPDTMVVSFQNGVEFNDIIGGIVGMEHMVGGIAQCSTTIAAPGVIKQMAPLQRIVMGELTGGTSDRIDALVAALKAVDVVAESSENIQKEIWLKFVFLASLAATTTLTRQGIGAIREDDDMRAFLMDCMREIVAVGRAKGIDLDEDQPEKTFGFIKTLPEGMVASTLHDLNKGIKIEMPWLSGAVDHLGQDAGVDTPAHRTVFAGLKAFSADRVW